MRSLWKHLLVLKVWFCSQSGGPSWLVVRSPTKRPTYTKHWFWLVGVTMWHLCRLIYTKTWIPSGRNALNLCYLPESVSCSQVLWYFWSSLPEVMRRQFKRTFFCAFTASEELSLRPFYFCFNSKVLKIDPRTSVRRRKNKERCPFPITRVMVCD